MSAINNGVWTARNGADIVVQNDGVAVGILDGITFNRHGSGVRGIMRPHYGFDLEVEFDIVITHADADGNATLIWISDCFLTYPASSMGGKVGWTLEEGGRYAFWAQSVVIHAVSQA